MHLREGQILSHLMERPLNTGCSHIVLDLLENAIVVPQHLVQFVLQLLLDEVVQQFPDLLNQHLEATVLNIGLLLLRSHEFPQSTKELFIGKQMFAYFLYFHFLLYGCCDDSRIKNHEC